MPTVASYCTTFLKAEMLHIYRQITSLEKYKTFVIAKDIINSNKFPFDNIFQHKKTRVNFIQRFWLKYILQKPPIVYRGEFQPLEKILTKNKADLLHIYFGHTGVHLLPFIEIWQKPCVVSFHGMDVQSRNHDQTYAKKMARLLEVLPLVLVRSESLKQKVIALGCNPEKIRINTTGIPTENFQYCQRNFPTSTNGEWHIIQACRLIEKKGIDASLQVFKNFKQKHPQAKFSIVGDGELKNKLMQIAKELGIAESVNFIHFVDQKKLNQLYQSAHIFIHPSQITRDENQEGIPNSMLEAMATGLPVISTFHGGIPEAVQHGKSGFLSPEKDVSGLTKNILTLANDKELWQKMSRFASESIAKNFSVSACISKLESYYDEARENFAKKSQ